MVLFWEDWRSLFTGDERLEHPDSRTMNIASNERDPNPLVLGHGLQVTDKVVSFPL